MKFRITLICLLPLLLCGCAAGTPSSPHPLLLDLLEILDEPPELRDRTPKICALVDAESLDEIVGLKVGDHEVTKHTIADGSRIEPPGSTVWRITRSKPFDWSHWITIVIEPGGACRAQMGFESFGF